jgi:GT2 family glycosyltransferase
VIAVTDGQTTLPRPAVTGAGGPVPPAVGGRAPWVAIVVVNWNDASDTIACLESLAGLRHPWRRVYVVDNASTDGSPEAIMTARPEVVLLQAAANLGYAGAFNLGRARALQDGAAYLWLLNNDVIVEPETLDALLAAAGGLGMGIYSPKILAGSPAPGRPDVLWYAGGFLDWQLKSHHFGRGQPDVGQHDRLRPVAWASGCSLFCSAEVARRVGPMEERYFLYLEDVDWCLQARAKGLPTYYVPQARVWHGISRSVSRLPRGGLRYYAWRNYYLLVWRWGAWWQRLYAAADLASRFLRIALRLSVFPAYRRDPEYHGRTLGLIDVVRGRFGQGRAWTAGTGHGRWAGERSPGRPAGEVSPERTIGGMAG